MKKKKLKKTWRKLRHVTEHRFAICKDREISLLNNDDLGYGWMESGYPYKRIDLHAPDTIIGVYVEGPIKKGLTKRGRVFITLHELTAFNIIDKNGKFILDKEVGMKALHPGVVDPIIRSVLAELSTHL